MATAPFDLHWTLTTPEVGANGNAKTYPVSALPTLDNDYFHITDDYVEFWAPVVGETTQKSEKTRSELREWLADGSGEQNWLGSGGNHSIGAAFSVLTVPTSSTGNQGSVFVGQIHADEGESPLFKFKYKAETATTGQMRVSFRAAPDEDAQPDVTLNTAIPIGARIQYYAKVSSTGQLSAYVEVNGVRKTFSASLSKWLEKSPSQKFYFKAGVYNNKKPEELPVTTGDGSRARFYKLTTTHS